MTPNFALSLSLDGIVLLHKSAAGWHSVGDADPMSETLAQELEVLRRTATSLSPQGIRCKLVIPNDQIRYLTLNTPEAAADARREAARAALDGATPYAVDDLVFDICVDRDETHVAAVAIETLNEAEAFAIQHRFTPISFCAWPAEDCSFVSEPYFGQTASAAALLEDGDVVEPEATKPVQTAKETEASNPRQWPEEELEQASSVNQSTEETDPEAISETPSFVSRRRVPTFRTEDAEPIPFQAASEGSVPGFGEPQTLFEEAPPKAPQPEWTSVNTVPAPTPIVRKTSSDVERFTIYGDQSKRKSNGRVGAGSALALFGIVVVLGIVAFAGGLVNNGVSDYLARLTSPKPTAQFTAPQQPQTPVTEVVATSDTPPSPVVPSDQDTPLETATLTDEDAAVLDALSTPEIQSPALSQAPDIQDQQAAYAVSGIWPVAPDVPTAPALVGIDDLYVTSIDPINPNFDAVALPPLVAGDHDLNFRALPSPAPAGTTFDLDARGMVVATRDGSLNPDGVVVFAGAPPARPPANLVKAETPGVDLSERLRLASFRPRERPENLIETSERAAFSGLTRSELAEIRPQLRPQSAQENALASASLVPLSDGNSRSLLEQPEGTSFDSATARAVVASLRPDARPRDFDKTVAKALEKAPTASTVTRVEPRAVTPKIPTNASVSREATTKNAINLRRVNLIGVYGKPSNRRALVRLGNGRYRKVEVGDRIDGGQVSAIGDTELRYQKSGRSIVLTMPRG